MEDAKGLVDERKAASIESTRSNERNSKGAPIILVNIR